MEKAFSKNQNSINLLTRDFAAPDRLVKIRKISIIFLGAYLFALAGLFGAFIFVSSQKAQVLSENQQLETEVQSQKASETLLSLLKNRSKVSQSTFAKAAPSTVEITNEIITFLPESVVLLNIGVDRDGLVLLSVKTATSFGLVALLDKIEAKNFASVKLNTIALDASRNYVASFEIRK